MDQAQDLALALVLCPHCYPGNDKPVPLSRVEARILFKRLRQTYGADVIERLRAAAGE